MKKEYIKPTLVTNIYMSNKALLLSGLFNFEIYEETDEEIDWSQLFSK